MNFDKISNQEKKRDLKVKIEAKDLAEIIALNGQELKTNKEKGISFHVSQMEASNGEEIKNTQMGQEFSIITDKSYYLFNGSIYLIECKQTFRKEEGSAPHNKDNYYAKEILKEFLSPQKVASEYI